MRSRLQAPFQSNNGENPYLKPLPPQVDINSGRGRFQQVNLGLSSAEDQTKIEKQVVVEEKTEETPFQTKHTTTTTTVIE